MALVAAARAAWNAARAVEERRAGRDPSAQEPERVARRDLTAVREGIVQRVVRLRLSNVVALSDRSEAGEEAVRLAMAFDDRLLLSDLAADLHRAHQMLMTLYPQVSEVLIEETRRLHTHTETIAADDAPEDAFGALADRLADWSDAVRALSDQDQM